MTHLTFDSTDDALQYVLEEVNALQLAFVVLTHGLAAREVINLKRFGDALDLFCETTAPRASEAVERLKLRLGEPQVGLTVIDGGKQ